MKGEHWLICYDISDRKQRYHIEKALQGVGERVQYSVFECRLTQHQFLTLRGQLCQWLDDGDKLHYFRLCEHCLKRRLTQGAMVAWQCRHFEYID